MKHRVAGRKLGRTSAHRLAVLRNLSTDLFRHERIQTTLMKAKELRPFAEKLITVGKRGDVFARRRVARHIHDRAVARKLVETLSTRFAERPGGYTRIIKLGPRRGDSAEMAIVELIGSEPTFAPKEEDRKERSRLGRIRERFSRRKAAPSGKTAAAQEAGEEEPGSEEKKERRPKRAAAAKGEAAPEEPKMERRAKAPKAAGDKKGRSAGRAGGAKKR